jgi:hypothetical protein
MTTIGLVACGKRKLGHPAPAAELYRGDLFRKASAYCEATYDRWFVLSALHGLVEPGMVLEPYDVTLVGMPARARRGWADRVLRQIYAAMIPSPMFFLHAGRDYADFLEPVLPNEWPVRGLGIGRQLAWYKERGF